MTPSGRWTTQGHDQILHSPRGSTLKPSAMGLPWAYLRHVHLARGFALASPADQICKIPPRFSPVSQYNVLQKVSPDRQHGSARWSCAGQLDAQSPRGEVVTAQAARGKMIFLIHRGPCKQPVRHGGGGAFLSFFLPEIGAFIIQTFLKQKEKRSPSVFKTGIVIF